MNIRTWLGYNNPTNRFSQVDKKVDSILTYFHKIALNFMNQSETSSITSLEKSLENMASDREVYIGFKNWFFEEGKDFLINSGKYLYAEDSVLCEELEYLEFVIASESSNIDEYPEETIGILVDVSDQFNDLIENAIITLELTEKGNSFTYPYDDFLSSDYHKNMLIKNLNYWNMYGDLDSCNNCENLFFI